MLRQIHSELSKLRMSSLPTEIDLPVPVGPQNMGYLPFRTSIVISLFILIESMVGTISWEQVASLGTTKAGTVFNQLIQVNLSLSKQRSNTLLYSPSLTPIFFTSNPGRSRLYLALTSSLLRTSQNIVSNFGRVVSSRATPIDQIYAKRTTF